MFMRIFTILSLSFLLVACSQPRTQLPQACQVEIENERQLQQQGVYDQNLKQIYGVPPTKRSMQKRLATVAQKVGPEAIQLCRKLQQGKTAQRCLFDVELDKEGSGFNAYADGSNVVIGRKLMELITREDHLAFIVAHEFAHNIMNHLQDLQTNVMGGAILGAVLDAAVSGAGGVGTGGGFSKLGAQMGQLSYSPAYEHEADYIGLYIMANAGYNLDEAPNVWRLMAAINPDAIYTRTTHPTTAERLVTMRKVVDEIKQKKIQKQPLIPQMKPVE